MITFACFVIAFISIIMLGIGIDDRAPAVGIAGAILLVGAGSMFVTRIMAPEPPPTPEQLAAIEKRKAEIEAAKIPVLFSEADGCKVYKFVDGYAHYFTKCGKEVSTDSTRIERSGKSSYTKIETIKTN